MQDTMPFLPMQRQYKLFLAEDQCLSSMPRAAACTGVGADVAGPGMEIWAISQRNEG